MIEILVIQPMEMYTADGWERYRPVGKKVVRITIRTESKYWIWEHYL